VSGDVHADVHLLFEAERTRSAQHLLFPAIGSSCTRGSCCRQLSVWQIQCSKFVALLASEQGWF
jgi:hypothetical protein